MAIEIGNLSASLCSVDVSAVPNGLPKFFGPWANFNFGVEFGHFAAPVDETVIALLNITNDLLRRQRAEPPHALLSRRHAPGSRGHEHLGHAPDLR